MRCCGKQSLRAQEASAQVAQGPGDSHCEGHRRSGDAGVGRECDVQSFTKEKVEAGTGNREYYKSPVKESMTLVPDVEPT